VQPFVAFRVLRFRLWVARLFRASELHTTLIYAGLVGFLGGLSAAAFRVLIGFFQQLLTGHSGGLVQAARDLVWWRRLAVPIEGALLAGLILVLGARLSRGRRATDFMEAIVLSDGVIYPRPVLVRCASSLMSIASGGSMGREGPMVQLAAMLASVTGRLLRLPAPRLRLLVACGVAAGIASAYKAPIAGSLFVAEIVLGSIAMESFGPLVFSAVIATLTTRQFSGRAPLYAYTGMSLHSNWEILAYVFVGLVAGTMGPLFLRLLWMSEAFFARYFSFLPLRFMAGGAVVGALSVWHPEVWGNGYSVVGRLIAEDWAWGVLCTTLVCKLVATAATVGSGAVGGVFTPTLLMGAALGQLCAKLYHRLFSVFDFDPRSYVLVGMGSFLAATTHAPLMAIIMLFEMTLDYDLVVPLMLACVIAHYTASGIDSRSIYSDAVARSRQRRASKLSALCVADLLGEAPDTLAQTASFFEVARFFARSQASELYVRRADGQLCGVISLLDIREYLDDTALAQLVTAYDIMDDSFPLVTPSLGLVEAAELFSNYPGERLPVVCDASGRKLLGTLSKTDLLLTMAHGSEKRTPPALP
jgi:CIC family chloride channel protein